MLKKAITCILLFFLILMILSHLQVKKLKAGMNIQPKRVTFAESFLQSPRKPFNEVVVEKQAPKQDLIKMLPTKPQGVPGIDIPIIESFKEEGIDIDSVLNKAQPSKVNLSKNSKSKVFSDIKEDNGLTLKGLDQAINVDKGYTWEV